MNPEDLRSLLHVQVLLPHIWAARLSTVSTTAWTIKAFNADAQGNPVRSPEWRAKEAFPHFPVLIYGHAPLPEWLKKHTEYFVTVLYGHNERVAIEVTNAKLVTLENGVTVDTRPFSLGQVVIHGKPGDLLDLAIHTMPDKTRAELEKWCENFSADCDEDAAANAPAGNAAESKPQAPDPDPEMPAKVREPEPEGRE